MHADSTKFSQSSYESFSKFLNVNAHSGANITTEELGISLLQEQDVHFVAGASTKIRPRRQLSSSRIARHSARNPIVNYNFFHLFTDGIVEREVIP
jgi:hypothetical protein